LLAGIGGDAWKSAANSVARSLGFPIRAYKIGQGCDYVDCYREWCRLRGIGENGAILVRPDHFVAWRSHELIDDSEKKLSSVFVQILGLPRP
jgi:hypothetical protein